MNLLNKVPGFRSKKKLKMIIASIYYSMIIISLLAVMGEIDLMLTVLSTLVYPFIACGIIDVIKYKNGSKRMLFMRKVGLPIIISLSLMFGSISLTDPTRDINSVESANIVKNSNESNKDKEEKNDVVENDVVEKVEESELHFINTGNSDSILIKQGNKAALIDAGDNDDEQRVVNYIKEQGITELEYVFATHPHADHIGGLDAVVDSIKIKNMFVSNGDDDTDTYKDFITSMSNKNVSPSVPLLNSEFKLGTGVLKVLSVANESDLNNNSIVILYTNGDDKVLLMGDSEAEIESKINTGEVDILKVGHHGSNSSSTKGFINKVKPKYAVITAGENNKYGHPHKETMDTLKSMNIEVHRNDECGNIVFKSTGKGLIVDCKEGSYEAGKKIISSNEPKNVSDSNTNTTNNNNSSTNNFNTANNVTNTNKNTSSNNGVTSNNNSNTNSNSGNATTNPTPQPTPTPEPTPQPSGGGTVYANGGSSKSDKYHKSATAHGMKGAIPMSESEAKASGYVACGSCYR